MGGDGPPHKSRPNVEGFTVPRTANQRRGTPNGIRALPKDYRCSGHGDVNERSRLILPKSSDIALVVSQAVNMGQGPRAGFVPASGPAIVGGVNTIDVTAASTAILSLNHSTYAESPELLSEIGMLLHGVSAPEKLGAALRRVQTDRGVYWKVAAER